MRTVDNASGQLPQVFDADDTTMVQYINGYSTSASSLGGFATLTTARTIIIAHRVDASNYAISIGWDTWIPGQIVEVYPDSNGPVTVFLQNGASPASFLDGASSMNVSLGARFVNTKAGWVRMGS